VDAIFAFWGTTGGGIYAMMDQYLAFRAAHPDIEVLLYEGGQGLEGSSGGGTFKLAAQTDPRMQSALVENYRRWFRGGGGMAYFYTLVGPWGDSGYWGLSQSVTERTGPKWQAAKRLMSGK
jgi:hypothetical protein